MLPLKNSKVITLNRYFIENFFQIERFPNLIPYINYWFFLLDNILSDYDSEIIDYLLKYECESGNLLNAIISYEYEYKNPVKFRVITKHFPFKYPFSFGYLPKRNQSLFEKILRVYMLLYLNNIANEDWDANIQNFIKNFNFSDNKINNIILKYLPRILRNFVTYDLPIKSVVGYTHALLDEQGYEILFKSNKKINIYGMPHGGGYNEFIDDYQYQLEKSISFSFDEIKLNNINDYKLILNVDINKKKSLCWAGKSKPIKVFDRLMKHGHYAYRDNSSINAIYNYLSIKKINYYFLPHKFSACIYNDLKIKQYIGDNIKIIMANSNVLLDSHSHTLVYYCIANNIKFGIVSNFDFEYNMTNSYKVFLDKLRIHGLYVNYNDQNGIEKLINYLTDDSDLIDI